MPLSATSGSKLFSASQLGVGTSLPLRSDASLAIGGTEPSRPTSWKSSAGSSGAGFAGEDDSVAVFGCASAIIFSLWTAGSSGSFGGGAALSASSLGSGGCSAGAEASAPLRISRLVRACPDTAAQTFAANPWADIV